MEQQETTKEPSFWDGIGGSILVNIARLIVSATLIFSGFVKAIDPLGFQYKIQDYVAAVTDAYNIGFFHDWGSLIAAVILSVIEFLLGINLLFAIDRRVTSKVTWLFMFVMTCITVWIFIDNPVSDCGCFGEAITLTNGETLLKNIILLVLTTIIAYKPMKLPRLISRHNQWIISNYSALFLLALSVYCLYKLPVIDFRPYHVGANIP
ncbi:MAG: DoxX family protein, partial [Prevotella sp.]|nr:DoxX family protein [Prevotella sp.]